MVALLFSKQSVTVQVRYGTSKGKRKETRGGGYHGAFAS